jgi:argininosuccinate synthase
MAEKQRVCLAYSGGLDTSCILAWLIEKGYDVICFMANIGQEEDFDAAKAKALKIGAKQCYVENVIDEFVKELCFPAIQCNATYENVYLLGTSLARPIIARAQIAVAQKEKCQFISHGCTGKGNDQVRFELAFYALQPTIQVIAPWRIPEFYETFKGRNDLLDYAAKKGIPVTSTKSAPWSMDENLAHCSYEAGILEDPNVEPPSEMWKLTQSPFDAPNEPEDVVIEFRKGLPVSLSAKSTGTVTEPTELFLAANALARKHGVGRIDIVENRFIGLKSRGCYETPGLTILRNAHIDIEGLVLDREIRALRDQFVTISWSRVLYNGLYFSPEREFLEASIIESQKTVNGQVRLKLYKGNCIIVGRSSETEKLYDAQQSSMDEIGDFQPSETGGFITVQAIRLKRYGLAKEERGESLVQPRK